MTHGSAARRATARVLLAVTLTGVFLLATGGNSHADGPGAGAGVDRDRASMISASVSNTCVVFDSGSVNCWGDTSFGQLGRATTTQSVGDDETPASAGVLSLGAGTKVVAVSTGDIHSCVLTDTGNIKCWGNGSTGRLGYGNTTTIGDDELPSTVGTVSLGGTATAIAAGSSFTCALLSDGAVRCWGNGTSGQLGYGNTTTIGDDELPSTVGAVSLGGTATAITAGSSHACALLADGSVVCWGVGTSGRLGYGNTNSVGDNELPSTVGAVSLGGTATAITAGSDHTCALMTGGSVKCWGNAANGQLGYGNTNFVGDNELPSTVGAVSLGGTAVAITAGGTYTCALMTGGSVKCWGRNQRGQLGYGNTTNIGDDELPSTVGTVSLGGTAVAITTGQYHTCAVMSEGSLKCWGEGTYGQLGYGNTTNIGDNELPSTVGTVSLGGTVLPSTTTTTSTTTTSTTVAGTTVSAVAVTTTSSTAPVATTTTTSTIPSSVKRGKSFTGAAVARLARITVKAGSRISLRVSPSTSSRCRVSGTTVKGLKPGACRVTITVKPKTGRSTVRTVTITVT